MKRTSLIHEHNSTDLIFSSFHDINIFHKQERRRNGKDFKIQMKCEVVNKVLRIVSKMVCH